MSQIFVYLIFIFLAGFIFFIVFYFSKKIKGLEKDKAVLSRLLEKYEKKFENSEALKNRALKIILNIDEGILVLDHNKKIFIANFRAREILGVKLRNLNGMHLSELAFFDGLKSVVPRFSVSHNVCKEEIEIGNSIVEFSATRLVFEEGNAGKLIVMRDITKEKAFDKTKNEFLLSTIHRIKTSMSSVRWLIKMFLGGDFGKFNKEQKDFMKKLYTRNESLLLLTSDLLNLTKIDNGAHIYRKNLVNIQDLVQSEATYFKDKIASKKIRFEFKKPVRELPKIMLDKEKVESAIQNLFDNALKYTQAKGTIKVFLKGNEKEIEFRISDTGIGIPENQQAEVFNKFFRAKNANKIEADGTGLGLFVAKKIIEDHGGAIGFESKENEGSEFYFTLPI